MLMEESLIEKQPYNFCRGRCWIWCISGLPNYNVFVNTPEIPDRSKWIFAKHNDAKMILLTSGKR